MTIPIVIPTHLRPEGSTYRFFRDFDPYVVVRGPEHVPADCPPERVITVPEPGITPARNAVLDHFRRFLMFDDDFRFTWSKPSGFKGSPPPGEVYDLLTSYLDEVPFVGMNMRAFSHAGPANHYMIRKPLGVFGLDQDRLGGAQPRFRFRVGEDMDFGFQLIEAGVPLVTVNQIVREDVPGQLHGEVRDWVTTGCNDWRTNEIIREDNDTLRQMWPGFVTDNDIFLFAKAWKHYGHDMEPWEFRADRAAERFWDVS